MVENNERIIWIIALIIVFFLGALQTKILTDISESKDDLVFVIDDSTRIAIETLNQNIKNLEVSNTMIYDVDDCQFITDRQEYWCVDVLSFQNSNDYEVN